MGPGRYDLELYDGDSFSLPLKLPDLTPFGGPHDLSGAAVSAEIRGVFEAVVIPLSVQDLDRLGRTLRLTLTAADVLTVPGKATWRLRVTQGAFGKTLLAGSVTNGGESGAMSDLEVLVTEPPALTVTVVEEPSPRVEVGVTPAAPEVVEVRAPGPAGPPGPKGEAGSVAPGSGDLFYVHLQSVPATLWTVPHGLGKRPSVTVVDSAGTQVEGDVRHLDVASLTIEFAFPFSGTALLN